MSRVPLSQLPALAHEVRERLEALPSKRAATLVFLQGELGAGKTTFMQALGKEFGVAHTLASPTYVLMKKYELHRSKFKTLAHLDLYRLEKPAEFAALKLEALLADPEVLICIEWPERAGEVLSKPDIKISFSHESASEGERLIVVQ